MKRVFIFLKHCPTAWAFDQLIIHQKPLVQKSTNQQSLPRIKWVLFLSFREIFSSVFVIREDHKNRS